MDFSNPTKSGKRTRLMPMTSGHTLPSGGTNKKRKYEKPRLIDLQAAKETFGKNVPGTNENTTFAGPS